jgi:predicted NBD/HSP70 family sugar kinase
MTVRVGVDVGGTTTGVQVFSSSSSLRRQAPTRAGSGRELAEGIACLVEDAVAEADLGPADSIGVGIPGQVDPVSGTVRHAVNLGLDGAPLSLAAILSDRLGVAVAIENDVRAAALGVREHLGVEGSPVDDLVFVSVGTGISAGVIIGGRLHRGAHGLAGEIGHAPLADDHTPCRCGLRGCLEAVAAGPAIAAGGAVSAGALFGPGSSDESTARTVATALARALLVLATTYDPEIFVLGGGIGPHAAPAVRTALIDVSAASPFGRALLTPDRVVTLPPGVDVGTIGAALLPTTTMAPGGPGARPGGTQP